MIPKKIHYCWFGKARKSDLIKRCIASWVTFCPDYEIVEWNESNFDINQNPFTKKMYEQKKWAFVSDYARFKILKEDGGIYLDTDMLLVKPIDELHSNSFFSAYEDETYISCGAIGAEKDNALIKKCLDYYNSNLEKLINAQVAVPKILTSCHNNLTMEEKQNIKIYPKSYFYPFNQFEIKKFNGNNAPNESYGVHLWNYSWGHPIFRFLNKYKIYNDFKKLLDTIGVKKIIKRLLKLA